MTIQKIGEELNLTKSTVGRILKMKEDRNDVTTTNRRGRCGRKRKTTTHDDRTILRNSLKDPRKISKDLQRDLAMAGVDIDSSTVRKRLLQAGRIARSPRKKQLLTDVMKKKRLVGTKKYKHWGKEEWRKVIFSNESHFEVHGHRSQYVRRSAGEPLNSFHIQQAPKHPPKKDALRLRAPVGYVQLNV